jgi:hypothetical protein
MRDLSGREEEAETKDFMNEPMGFQTLRRGAR